MIILQLIYASIKNAVFNFPDFFWQFGLAILVYILFASFGKACSEKIEWKYSSSNFFWGFGIYALLAFLLLSIPLPIDDRLLLNIFSIGCFSYTIFKRSFLFPIEKYKIFYLLLFGSSLIYFNLIYQTGMHDEYQHHAVVKHFLETGTHPFPYQLSEEDITYNDFYHVGWYYPIAFFAQFSIKDLPIVIDIIKLSLLIGTITFVFQFFNKKTSTFSATFWTIAMLFSGPALFFFDTYSRNVIFHASLPTIFPPIIFELAGITWFGLTFLFVYAEEIFLLKKHKGFLLYSIVWLSILYNLNRFFCGLGLLYLTYLNFESLVKKPITTLGFIFLSTIFISFSIKNIELITIQAYTKYGFPINTDAGITKTLPWEQSFILSFGLLPILVIYFYKRFPILSASMVLLLSIMYFLNYCDLIALTKMYKPVQILSVYGIFLLSQSVRKNRQIVLFVLITTSLVFPTLHLASGKFTGMQEWWKPNGEVEGVLNGYLKSDTESITVDTDSIRYYLIQLTQQKVLLRQKNSYILEP